jgi:hypothetical protein
MQQTEKTKQPKKFAVLYIPGVLMVRKSVNPIRAYIRHILADYDLETRTWEWNPFRSKEESLDQLNEMLNKIPNIVDRKLIIVGESYGLDLAVEFRQRFSLDSLIVGSSPGPAMLYPTLLERRAQALKDRKFSPEFLNNNAGRALIRNWFKWDDTTYVHPSPYMEQKDLIIFTGVACENPNPTNQTSLTRDHIALMQNYPGIMSVNFDGVGHRVLRDLAPLIALTCQPYMLVPDLQPSGHFRLPNVQDNYLYHPMSGPFSE